MDMDVLKSRFKFWHPIVDEIEIASTKANTIKADISKVTFVPFKIPLFKEISQTALKILFHSKNTDDTTVNKVK